jgi:agmatine deiminase
MKQRFLAAWEPQDAILISWPHNNFKSDFLKAELTQLYEALVTIVCDYADVLIALPNSSIEPVKTCLETMTTALEYIYFYPVDTKNIWVRDYGPVCIENDDGITLLTYSINNREKTQNTVNLDCEFTQKMQSLNAFPAATLCHQDWNFSVSDFETDGNGTLLIRTCGFQDKHLSSAQSFGNLSLVEIEAFLKTTLGFSHIHWINHGEWQGADDRGCIANLARFAPNNTILYTACDDEQDENFVAFKKMEDEITAFRNKLGQPYRLLPLPWAGVQLGESDNRLCSSYAAFMVVNEAVLVPIFDALSDEDALETISLAFPGFEVMGVPSHALIEFGGSLHRMMLPLPEGVIFSKEYSVL